MTATKPVAAPSIYMSGFCGVSRHDRCRVFFPGAECTCPCHTQPEPESATRALPLPQLCPGSRLVCASGTRWGGEDLGGQELEVVSVHDYPPEVGGPVFVCRWPGTTATAGPHLQADQLAVGVA